MTDRSSDDLLCRAAVVAEMRPIFLAATLARYRAAEGLDNASLARKMGIPPDRLCGLALCRRPRESAFREDVEAIATRFSVAPTVLAAVIRHADALGALSSGVGTAREMMAAARDAEDDDLPDPEDDTP